MDGSSCPFLLMPVLCLVILCVCHNGEAQDQWAAKLDVLTNMVTTLSSKVDKKIVEMNFLDYAFQVNDVNKNIELIKQSIFNLEKSVTGMESKTEAIKQLLTNSRGSCREGETEKRTTHVSSSGGGRDDTFCKDLSGKLEDYGYKLSKSQQELLENGQQRQRALTNLLDTVKNGFTKTFQKVDVLPNAERQVARMSSVVSGMSSQLPQVFETVTSISERFVSVQSQISVITQMMSNNTHKSNDKDFSASLSHAVELGYMVNTDLIKLSEVEPDIAVARKSVKSLRTELEQRRSTSMDTLKNLTKTLEKIETKTIPLLFSLPYNFQGIRETLQTMLDAFDKERIDACNFQDVFKLELKRIKDSIDNQGGGSCSPESPKNTVVPADGNEGESSPMKQQEVFENLSYVKAAVKLIKTDLQKIFQGCPDDSFSTAKPLGMIMG